MNGPDWTESSLQLESLSPSLGMMLRVLVTPIWGGTTGNAEAG